MTSSTHHYTSLLCEERAARQKISKKELQHFHGAQFYTMSGYTDVHQQVHQQA